MKNYLFTSESVTEGHPDKVCDQVSDAVLDAILAKDPQARVACEVSVATGFLLVMGEVSADCYVDVQAIARNTVRRIGYTDSRYGFDADSVAVLVALNGQSPDIALGVDRSLETKSGVDAGLGSGDQGMMFGYATDETDGFMPMPIYLAHKLTRRLAEVRKSGLLPYLGPDGKSQVTVEYRDGIPSRVDTVVISAQHSPDVGIDIIREDILRHVIRDVIPYHLLDKNTKYFINPTDRFVVGGPHGDTGLTGRKIIVDTYGGFARHVIRDVIPYHLLDKNTKYFINPTGRFVVGGPHGDTGLTGRKIIVDTYGGFANRGPHKDADFVGRGGATERSECPTQGGRSIVKFTTTRRRGFLR